MYDNVTSKNKGKERWSEQSERVRLNKNTNEKDSAKVRQVGKEKKKAK